MITEKELLDFGFLKCGEEEDDIYYKINLEPEVFNLYYLHGCFDTNGNFDIFNIHNRKFTDIKELIELFEVNRFVKVEKI